MAHFVLRRWPIGNERLLEYLHEEYTFSDIRSVKINQLSNIKPLLQENFGKADDLDCTLTSITTILTYYCNKTPQEIYDVVLKYASKFCYTERTGTQPPAMRTIMNKAAKELGVNKKAFVRYGKNISFNFAGIKQHIDQGRPLMLSMFKDGRQWYEDHSVTIIGYAEHKLDGKKTVRMLKVYDNWYPEVMYVNYELMHMFSSIHYYN